MVHHVNTHVYMYVSYVYSLHDLSIMSHFGELYCKNMINCCFSLPLAAILIFNLSNRFKVCHHIQNKSAYHYKLILKISCFYPENARFYDF